MSGAWFTGKLDGGLSALATPANLLFHTHAHTNHTIPPRKHLWGVSCSPGGFQTYSYILHAKRQKRGWHPGLLHTHAHEACSPPLSTSARGGVCTRTLSECAQWTVIVPAC